MKRTLAVVLALVMVFCFFAACGEKKAETKTDAGDNATTTTQTTNTQTTTTQQGEGNVKVNEQGVAEANKSTIGMDYPSYVALTPDQINPSDKTLNIAFSAEPPSCNPLISGQGVAMYSTVYMFDTLLQYNSKTSELIPWLATEWNWIEDTVLRVKVRDDVYSHAGDHYTANDTLYSLQWGNDCAALATYVSSVIDIDRCKVVDDYTIDIAVKSPNPFFVYELARICYIQVVGKTVEDMGGRDSTAVMDANDYSTGPYGITSWEKGQVMHTARNDNWWNKVTPYYAGIDVYYVTDGSTRAMGIEAGDYDFDGEATLSLVFDAMDDDSDAINGYVSETYSMMNFVFNSNHEIFQNKALRQAISLAVNYDAVNTIVFGGKAIPATSIIAHSLAWYYAADPGEEEYCHNDVEAAKAKLVEAGYPNGFTFDMIYHGGNQSVIKAAEVIQSNLKEAGITCNCSPLEPAVFNETIRTDNWDCYCTINPGSSPLRSLVKVDPALTHGQATGSCGTKWYDGPGGNEYISELVNDCLYNPDLKASAPSYEKIQDIVREYVPFFAISETISGGLCKPDIVNIEMYYGGNPFYTSIYEADYIK